MHGRVQQSVSRCYVALGLALLAGFAVASARAQNAPQPAVGAKPGVSAAAEVPAPASTPPDTVVMRVGNTQVTAADMQEILRTLPPPYQREVALQGFKRVGEVYALRLALYQKALAEGLDQTPEFKKQLEEQRLMMLASTEYQKIRSDIKVSQSEMDDYYKNHSSDYQLVEIRRIMIRKKEANAPADAPGLPEAEAKAKADAIRQAIASGEDATKVADKFKMENVVFFDPKPEAVHRGQLPAQLDQAAWSLKDGGLSEIEDNPANLYFIQVVKREQQSVHDVAREIQTRISEEKFQQALKDAREQAKIWLDPEYFGPPKRPAPGAAVPPPPPTKKP
jgi:parvulin-like peptidyl-prolyl isomerase